MVRFHRTQYSSGDAVLIATTAVSISSIESAARRSWGEFSTRRPPGLAFPHDRPRSARELRVDLPGRSQVEIRVGGASIGRRSADFPAAYLANEILGGRPLLSRLFQRIRERAGLVYGATSALESMRYGGYWYAQAGTGAERWRRVVPLLRAEIARMARRVVGVRELATIRESTIGEIPLALDTTSEAHELAVDVAYHDLPLDYWARWPDALREVTNSQIRDVARAAMDARHSVTVIAGPLGPAK